jgi:hypothetical protein
MVTAFGVFNRYVGDTYVIGSKQVCSGASCRALQYVECERPLQAEQSQGPSPFGDAAVKSKLPLDLLVTPDTGMIKNLDPGAVILKKPIKRLGKAKAKPAPAAPAAADPEPAPAEPGANMANVNSDVDVYDVPGGGGTVIGMLEGGSTVAIAVCQEDSWCRVQGDAVPGGAGWVWKDFLKP